MGSRSRTTLSLLTGKTAPRAWAEEVLVQQAWCKAHIYALIFFQPSSVRRCNSLFVCFRLLLCFSLSFFFCFCFLRYSFWNRFDCESGKGKMGFGSTWCCAGESHPGSLPQFEQSEVPAPAGSTEAPSQAAQSSGRRAPISRRCPYRRPLEQTSGASFCGDIMLLLSAGA